MFTVLNNNNLVGSLIKKIAGILIFHAMGLWCFAQADSLFHYLTIAAQKNPVVLQNYFEYRAALQKLPQAGALQDPQVDFGIFLTPMELIGGKQLAEVRLMQMFPWFGTLRSAKDEMSHMANAKYEVLLDSKLRLYYDVQKTWYELYKLKEKIRITERNLEILHTIERLATVRFTNAQTGRGNTGTQTPSSDRSGTNTNGSSMQGMGNTTQPQTNQSYGTQNGAMTDNSMGTAIGSFGLSDIYKVQIEMGDIQNNLSLLKNNQTVALARFNAFLNRPFQMPVAVPDSITLDTLGYNLKSIEDSMLANNPMLDMLEYERKSLESKMKMVTRMGYPMVGIGLNYSIIGKYAMSESKMNGEDMVMPMISLTLPVYRKKYKAMQNETNYLIQSVTNKLTATSNELMTEYYEAVQFFEDSRRRIKLYTDQGKLAKSSLNILMKEFATSSAGLTEILRLRQQVLEYDYKLVEAVTDYKTSIAWLNRLGALIYPEIKEISMQEPSFKIN